MTRSPSGMTAVYRVMTLGKIQFQPLGTLSVCTHGARKTLIADRGGGVAGPWQPSPLRDNLKSVCGICRFGCAN
jgi:hypothetical protein